MFQTECCLRGHSFPITALHNLGSDLVSGDMGGSIVVWNMKFRRPKLLFKASTMGILQIRCIRSTIIVQSRDNIISMWSYVEADAGQCSSVLEKFIKCDSLKFCCFELDQKERILYVLDDQVLAYDFGTNTTVHEFAGTDMKQHGAIMCLSCWMGNICIGFEDGTILTSRDKSLLDISKLHSEPVLTLSSIGDILVSAGASDKVVIFKSGDEAEEIILSTTGVAKVDCYVVDDDVFIICGCWDGSVIVVNNSSIEQTIREHRKGILSLSVDSASKRVFAGGEDCKITVFKLQDRGS